MAEIRMLGVPPGGPSSVALADRGAGRRWTAEIRPFEIGATVVTRELWRNVMGGDGDAGGDRLPAVDVSWREAVEFCNRLSRQHGLTPVYAVESHDVAAATTGNPAARPVVDDWQVGWNEAADGYRLPTEAEWQIACQAGTTGPHYAPLDEIAWYAENSDNRLRPVAGKTPNAWDLFDMIGGVWEWCWDLYDADVYGPYRVIRGGGWADPAWSCRAGVRRKTHPTARIDDLGFRVAR